jgi:hypothetical protein
MGRTVWRICMILVSLGLAISAAVGHNLIGAAFFGVVTLSLIWFALWPERDSAKETYPLRGMALGAVATTAVSVFLVLAAVGETEDATGRVLSVLAALAMIALALLLWGMTFVMWRRGWRWSSATTWGELQAARATGQRVEAPPRRTSGR